MLKRINTILNTIIGAFIGVFIGRTIFTIWQYFKYPEMYMANSAPWYTSIIVNGLFTVAVVVIALLIKLLIKRKMKEE